MGSISSRNSTFLLHEKIEKERIRCKIKIASNGG